MATQSVKDILDTEIPKPSFVLSPSVPAPLPSDVTLTRNGQDNVARTLDPYSGRFEQVGEDTPRVYGSQQSLLVEAAQRTNPVNYSSDSSQWNQNSGTGTVSLTAATSVIKGETAQECTGESGTFTQLGQSSAGTFSGNDETVSFIVEQSTSDACQVDVRNDTTGSRVVLVELDWANDSSTIIAGSGLRVNHRTLRASGPNGSRLVKVIVTYGSVNAENTNGEARALDFRPDPNKNGNSTYLHHAQIEEAPNASSAIVTDSSAKTRAGDDVTIFDYSNDPDQDQPDWWNPNEGTLFYTITPQFYTRSSNFKFLSDGEDRIYIGFGRNPLSFFVADVANNDAKTKNLPTDPVTPFQPITAAISIKPNDIIFSTGGNSVNSGAHDGTLLDTTRLVFDNADSALVRKLVYFPRALPESTLNTLTS